MNPAAAPTYGSPANANVGNNSAPKINAAVVLVILANRRKALRVESGVTSIRAAKGHHVTALKVRKNEIRTFRSIDFSRL
jgi:hypothetical protein